MLRTIKNGQILAGADLSAKQFYQVALNSNGEGVVCGAGAAGVGVLQNAPKQGEAMELVQAGETEIVVAAAMNANTPIGSDANGKAAALVYGTDTTKFVHGRTLEAVTGTVGAARRVRAVVNFLVPHRAA